jgi:hypothetical protein
VSKPEARLVLTLLHDAVNEAVDYAVNEEYIAPKGLNLDLRAEHLQQTKSHIVLTIMAALRASDRNAPDPYRPEPAKVEDQGLYGRLKEGFDEGREPRQGTQKPDESSTKPEQYEQLQLPGMEEY